MRLAEHTTTTISAPVRELLVTAAVIVAIVAPLTVVARAAFPDPAIRGSHCPATLGIQGTAECVSEWHRSHAERHTTARTPWRRSPS